MEFEVGVVVNHVPELTDHEPVKVSGSPTVDQPAGEFAGEVPVQPADKLALVPVCWHDVGVVFKIFENWWVSLCACAC